MVSSNLSVESEIFKTKQFKPGIYLILFSKKLIITH